VGTPVVLFRGNTPKLDALGALANLARPLDYGASELPFLLSERIYSALESPEGISAETTASRVQQFVDLAYRNFPFAIDPRTFVQYLRPLMRANQRQTLREAWLDAKHLQPAGGIFENLARILSWR